jgi:hypothetical protein
MANKKINQLDTRAGAALTDLILIGDPTSGTSFKLTATDFKTLLNNVPYTGATTNVNLGEFGLLTGQLTFDQTPTGTAGVGVMRWNDSDGTIDLGLKGGNVTLQVGQELVQRVVNKSGINLLEANYQVVRVSDAQGQRLAVQLAQGNNDANSTDTIGIVTETINDNQEGFVTTSGLVRNINTTGSLQGETWADGDVLYLSPTVAGRITKVKPTAPNHSVILGYVVYAHANNGKIFVKVDNGYEIGELHDVYAPTPSNNDGIFWNTANSRYQNNSIAGVLGYTPISGSGASGQVSYWNGTNSQTGSNNLFWDAANGRLGIGTNTPARALDVRNSGIFIANVSGYSTVLHVENTGNASVENKNVAIFVGARGNSSAIGDNTNVGIWQKSNILGNYANIIFYNSGGNDASFFGTEFVNHNFAATSNFIIATASAAAPSVKFKLFSTGNLVLQNGGTFTDGGQRLQVQGDAFIKGSGATSATNALLIQNSSSANLLIINNAGTATFGGTVQTNVVRANTSSNLTFEPGASNLPVIVKTFAADGSYLRLFNPDGAFSGALNQASRSLLANQGYAPTSGTGTMTWIEISPTINQTGGANGITRGLYVNPTLTAAADWRSIEWSNNSGWGLYGAGTANNYLGGSLGIGSASLSNANLAIEKNISGSTSAYGVLVNSVIQSGVTANAYGFRSILTTQAASFTLSNIFHFVASQTTQGAGSIVTTQIGYECGDMNNGYTNIAYRGQISQGTLSWNLYMNGTASNYLAGQLLIGTTTKGTFALDVNGTARVSGASTFNGAMTVAVNQNGATLLTVRNQTSGTDAVAVLNIAGANGNFQLVKRSPTTNAYKIFGASDAGIYNDANGDIAILNDNASGNIKFAAGGSSTAHMTIKSNGRINMSSLPTSSVGLSSGDLWNNLGILSIA